MLPSRTLGRFFSLRCSNSLSCTNEYLAIHSGGPLCMNSFRALIVERLQKQMWCSIEQGGKYKVFWKILRNVYCPT